MARWDRLPVPSGPLLGRDAVLAAIDEAFASGARLVTLVGPAGVGKTRTAIEWAERGRRPVRFADLAGLTELGGLCREVGDVLDLALLGGSAEEHAQRIARALAARGALVLICDDLEALVPLAARTFAAWLDAAPRLAILGTSRQALGLPEERVLGIEPLGPGDGRALFLARAAYVLRREYVPNEDDLRAIDAIVARLDGLPLAIELASARIAVASPARIAALLLRELDLLADPKRANERHRSLRDALDASWALLDGPLRRALVRASVLEGEFGLDVAAGVIAHEEADPVAARIAALDRLQELAERSLVQVRDDGGERRFRLLSAIRAHARERLAQLEDGAELERVRARALLEAVEPLVAESRRSPAALRALLSESRELESVLSRAIEEGRTTDALRALAALGRARTLRGPGIPYLETAARLAPALASAPPALRADCFAWIGRVALTVGRYPDAIEAFARAEAIEREHGSISRAAVLATRIALLRHYVGDDDGADAVLAAIPDAIDAEAEANVQEARGVLALRRDRYARAREHLERAIELARELGLLELHGRALGYRAWCDIAERRLPAARDALERASAMLAEMGEARLSAAYAGDVGLVWLEEGAIDAARARLSEALEAHRRLADRWYEAERSGHLGYLELIAGRLDRAREHLEEAVRGHRAGGDERQAALFDAARAACAAELGLAEEVERELDALGATLASAGLAAIGAIFRAHVALVRERGSGEAAARARALVERAEGALGLEARLAARALASALARLAGATPRALAVARDGAWIARGSEKTSLDGAPRRILAALAAARELTPGRALDVDALFAAGWPSEGAPRDKRTNRVRVTLTRLRRAGLREVLIARSGGYLLDPSAPIRVL